MRVLVTAATKYGATGEIAQAFGEVFTERGWLPWWSHPTRSRRSTASTW